MSDLGPVDPGRAADAAWLRRWRLRPMGDSHTTSSSKLMPVLTEDGIPAMLKIAHTEEEERGGELLAALDGHGAARLLRRDGEAALIERATGRGDLVRLVRAGHDDEATRIICGAAAAIHGASASVLGGDAPPRLIELRTWYRHLFAHADELGPLHRRGAEFAAALLDDARDEVVLHGDLHHENVLAAPEGGWRVIDPQPMSGDVHYELAPMLFNRWEEVAGDVRAGVRRRFHALVDEAGLDEGLARDWVVVRMVLNAYWAIEDAERLGRPLDTDEREWITTCLAVTKAVQD